MKLKVKQHIRWSPTPIRGMKPLKTFYPFSTDKYYLVNNANLKFVLAEMKTDFPNMEIENVEWDLNRWAVGLADNFYRLNKFINIESPLKKWTNKSVIDKTKIR